MQNLTLSSATKSPIITIAETILYIRQCGLRSKIAHIMTEILLVDLLIGSVFMQKYATSMNPKEEILKQLRSRSSSIPSRVASDKSSTTVAVSPNEEEHRYSDYVRGSKMSSAAKLRARKPI